MYTQTKDIMIHLYIKIYNDHHAVNYADWTITNIYQKLSTHRYWEYHSTMDNYVIE